MGRSLPLFISYAVEDSGYVAALAARIEAELQFPTWYFERDEPVGVYYRDEIIKRIDASCAVLVVLSPKSGVSLSVEREFALANRLGRPVIGLVIGDTRHSRIDAGMTRSPVMFELRVTNLLDGRAGRDPIPQLRNALAALAQTRRTIQLIDAVEALPELPEAANPGSDPIGQTIRGYTFIDQIAATAISAVYRAREEAVQREVAIKIILPKHAASSAYQEHFRAEARRIASLEHQHIVPLYGYWSDSAGGSYLVMRLLEGGTLSTLISAGAQPPGVVARIIRQVSEALAYAHHRGVMHLDIKPANILRDRAGNTFVSDFGIARSQAEGDARRISYTPGYAPPEQQQGANLTPQADVYSLAVVATELLLGARLFAGTDWQIKQGAGLPTAVIPRLPTPVVPVLQRALSPSPVVRHPDIVSFSAEIRRALQAVQGMIHPDEDELPTGQSDAPNPYLGLRPFTEHDSGRFFGRDVAIRNLIAQLADSQADHRFLAVVGASGSGKSSLVQAGLIPALRDGLLPGSDRWRIQVLRLGIQPLDNLASALIAGEQHAPTTLRELVATGGHGLHRAVLAVLPPNRAVELLLVIDQFEELFTLISDPRLQQHLLINILTAVREPASRLRVIVTLRGDFYDRLLQDSEFSMLLLARTVWVTPLSEHELEDVIVQPSRTVGVGVQRSLVREILADLEGQPGMLPLLQYALADLFERREGGPLSLETYRSRDGVRGTLGRRAEELFAELSEGERRLAEQVFLRLVSLGEGAEDTRRRMRRKELIDLVHTTPPMTYPDPAPAGNPPSDSSITLAGSPDRYEALPPVIHTLYQEDRLNRQGVILLPDSLARVLDRYGDARLLTFDRERSSGEPTVELAHEALLHRDLGWRRLCMWLDSARDDIRTQRRMAELAVEWQRHAHDPAFLSTGGTLAQFEATERRRVVDLTHLERAYLETSVVARAQAQTEEEARRSRELDQAQRLAVEQAERARLAHLQVAKEQERALERETTNLRLRRQATGLRVFLIFVLIASFAAGSFGWQAQQNADAAQRERVQAELQRQAAEISTLLARERGRLSRVRELALESERALTIAPQRSVLLSLEAIGLTNGFHDPIQPTAEQSLRNAVRELSSLSLPVETQHISALVLSTNGNTLVAGTNEGGMYWWDLRNPDPVSTLRTLQGHRGVITKMILSPDGHTLMTASSDGTIRGWNLETPTLESVYTLSSSETSIEVMILQPDGRRLITGSTDGSIQVWDMNQPDHPVVQAILQGHREPIAALDISADGSILVSGSYDDTIRIWDLRNPAMRTPIHILQTPNESIWTLALSDDGQVLVTSGIGPTARIWDLTAISPMDTVRTLEGHTDTITDLMFVSGSRTLLSSSRDSTIRRWNLNDLNSSLSGTILRGHEDSVRALAMSADGQTLLSGSFDATARVWNLSQADSISSVRVLRAHEAAVTRVAVSGDGRTAVTAGEDNTVRVWGLRPPDSISRTLVRNSIGFTPWVLGRDNHSLIVGDTDGIIRIWSLANPGSMEPTQVLTGHTTQITSLQLSEDGQRLISGSVDGSIRIWEARNGRFDQPSDLLSGHASSVYALSLSRDGNTLITNSTDGTLGVWDLAGVSANRSVHLLSGWQDTLSNIALISDSRMLVTTNTDGTIHLWDLQRFDPNQPTQALRGHQSQVMAIAFDAERNLLITGSQDQTIRIWPLNQADPSRFARILQGHSSAITALAVSASEGLLISASLDGTVRLWNLADPESRESTQVLRGHHNEVVVLALTSDGRTLVTGSFDDTARIWDLSAPDPNSTMRVIQHKGGLYALALAEDGQLLVTGGLDGTMRIWDMSAQNLIAPACRAVGRNLSLAEWQQFFPGEVYRQTCPNLPGIEP